ncbi:hypothetical protein D3C78_1773150 [compost metagenome]
MLAIGVPGVVVGQVFGIVGNDARQAGVADILRRLHPQLDDAERVIGSRHSRRDIHATSENFVQNDKVGFRRRSDSSV